MTINYPVKYHDIVGFTSSLETISINGTPTTTPLRQVKTSQKTTLTRLSRQRRTKKIKYSPKSIQTDSLFSCITIIAAYDKLSKCQCREKSKDNRQQRMKSSPSITNFWRTPKHIVVFHFSTAMPNKQPWLETFRYQAKYSATNVAHSCTHQTQGCINNQSHLSN